MEYGCVFVMRHRQGLSGKVGSLQCSSRGVGDRRSDLSFKGTSTDWLRAGQERDTQGLPQV